MGSPRSARLPASGLIHKQVPKTCVFAVLVHRLFHSTGWTINPWKVIPNRVC